MTATHSLNDVSAQHTDWDHTNCAPWCSSYIAHGDDPACWGEDHVVNLTLEEGFPHDAVDPNQFDPPRVAAFAYRSEPGRVNVVYLHCYRPSDVCDVDAGLHLTVAEARELADALLSAVAEIKGCTSGKAE